MPFLPNQIYFLESRKRTFNYFDFSTITSFNKYWFKDLLNENMKK